MNFHHLALRFFKIAVALERPVHAGGGNFEIIVIQILDLLHDGVVEFGAVVQRHAAFLIHKNAQKSRAVLLGELDVDKLISHFLRETLCNLSSRGRHAFFRQSVSSENDS